MFSVECMLYSIFGKRKKKQKKKGEQESLSCRFEEEACW